MELTDSREASILKAVDGSIICEHGGITPGGNFGGFHHVVEYMGRYYDAFTGPQGATWDEYLKFWHSDTGPNLVKTYL